MVHVLKVALVAALVAAAAAQTPSGMPTKFEVTRYEDECYLGKKAYSTNVGIGECKGVSGGDVKSVLLTLVEAPVYTVSEYPAGNCEGSPLVNTVNLDQCILEPALTPEDPDIYIALEASPAAALGPSVALVLAVVAFLVL